MPDFDTLTVRIIGDSSSFTRAMATSATAASAFSSKAKAIGAGMSKFVTLPLVAAGAASVKMAADFEQSITNAVSVTGLAGKAAVDARNDMSTLAKTLGAETAFSAKDAADAMYDLASAGWKTGDMGKGLRGIMDLAAATQSDLQMTTEAVTSAMSQFSLKTSESGRVADVYTKAISASRATMDSLASGMKMVGPVANSLGFSIEDTTAALAMLNDAGIEGTAAGTALRGALSALMNPVGQSKEALKAMGLSMDQVNPKTHSLAEILNTLKGAGMDTKDAVMLFGREAAPAMLALADKGGGALKKLTTELEKSGGTAEKVAKTQMNTLAGQSDQLLGSLETLGISIGTVLIPPLTSLVKKLIPLVNWFTNLPTPVKNFAVGVAIAAAAAGPLIWILGSLVGAVAALLPVLAPVAGFLLGPWGVAIAAAVLAGVLIIKNWDAIKKKAEEVFPGLGDTVKSAVEGIKTAFLNAKISLKDIFDGDQTALESAKQSGDATAVAYASAFNNRVKQDLSEGDASYEAGYKLGQQLVEGIKNFLSEGPAIDFSLLWKDSEGGGKGKGGGAQEAGKKQATGFVNGLLIGIREEVKKVNWSSIWKDAVKLPTIKFEGSPLGKLTAGVRKDIASLHKSMTSGLNGIAANVAKTVKNIGTGAVNILKGAWNGLKNIAASTWKAVSSAVSNAGKSISKSVSNAAKSAWNALKSAWNSILNTTKQTFQQVGQTTSSTWTTVKNVVVKSAQSAWHTAVNAWNSLTNSMASLWGKMKSAASSAWTELKNTVVSAAKGAWKGATGAITSLWKGVGRLWSQMISGAGSKLEEWKNTVTGKFKAAKEGALGWIGDLWQGIQNFLSDLGLGGGKSSNAKPRRGGGRGGKKVKKFARGGIATEPGIVGEGGDPEAVVNLRKRTPESVKALKAAIGSPNYAFAMPPKQSWDLYGGDKVVGAHEGNMGPFKGLLKSTMGAWKGVIGSGNDATVSAGVVPGGNIGVTSSSGKITIESGLTRDVAAAVLKHELGHAAGLGHGGSGIMRERVSGGMDVTSDDIAALKKYYGISGKSSPRDEHKGDKKPGGGGGGGQRVGEPRGGGGGHYPDGGKIARRVLRNVPKGGNIAHRVLRNVGHAKAYAKSANALGPTHYNVVPAVQKVADKIAEETGTSWNTYVGHGLPGGSREDYTVDFWGGARGTPLSADQGFATADKALQYQPPDVLYMIRQGEMWRDGGFYPWPEDPHMDHTHVSWNPGKATGGIGGIFNAAAKVAEFISSINPFPSLPVLGSQLSDWAGSAVGYVKDYLLEKVSSLASLIPGGDSPGALSLADAVARGGWPAEAQRSAIGVAWEESSARADARNASGAYGLFQIMPETAKGLGADYNKLGDPVYNSQVAAKLYGSSGWSPWAAYPPSEYAMGQGGRPVTGYRRGGIIPGPTGMKFLAEVEAGERILPIGVVDAFDRLAGSIELWRRDGAEFLGSSLAGVLPTGADPVVAELQAIREENAENAAVQAALLDALPPRMKRSVDESLEKDPRTQKAIRRGIKNSEGRASLAGSRGWTG